MNKLALSIFLAAVSGCSSWPEHGHGGDAQMDSTHDYYIAQVNSGLGPVESDHTHYLTIKGQLETQWNLHSLKLDTLALRGGQECLPARVREVAMMSKRSRRELDGNLLEDAQNSLVILHRKLDELERRLVYIQRHTQCNRVVVRNNNFTSVSENRNDTDKKYYLLSLLNDDYSFDINSDQITPHYKEKLEVAAYYLNNNKTISLYINGHTDAKGGYQYNQLLALKRGNAVKQVLTKYGVEETRLIVRSFGEQLPIASNADAVGRMKNRRVVVEIIEEDQNLIFEDSNYYFQNNSSIDHKSSIKKIKHWNKKLDEGWNHEL